MRDTNVLKRIEYIVGCCEIIETMENVSALSPFEDEICSFFSSLSNSIIKNPKSRSYPDVMTFAFWIRKAAVLKHKEIFEDEHNTDEQRYLGLGLLFHIAPSNVPVNFAYSLATGLMLGNANIVRLPSKPFPQTELICSAINDSLERFPGLKPYICLVKYGHDREINDVLSELCDARIIWGGDETIAEIRQSSLKARSREIAFADRYSLTVIDSDFYMDIEQKPRVADDFYNDTYLTDQNACTSPSMVIWKGKRIEEAKRIFWETLYIKVNREYEIKAIQSIDKLDMICRVASKYDGIQIQKTEDNLITRVSVLELSDDMMSYACHSGLFYEYECQDITEIISLCNNRKVQTLSYIDDKKNIERILKMNPSGIDRIVPVGRTMDFDLVWDGYDLRHFLTRTISVR